MSCRAYRKQIIHSGSSADGAPYSANNRPGGVAREPARLPARVRRYEPVEIFPCVMVRVLFTVTLSTRVTPAELFILRLKYVYMPTFWFNSPL